MKHPCKQCGAEEYKAAFFISTASDAESDTDMVWLRCTSCDARYLSYVTSDTNVVWDQDHGRNQGFRCDTPEWDRTLAQARRCPHPKDPGCVCVAHSEIPKFGEAAWYWSY